MSTDCTTYITPTLIQDPCGGETKSTDCVIKSAAITYLSLPVNSTLTAILQAYLTSLIDARARISVLESIVEDFETRISALE